MSVPLPLMRLSATSPATTGIRGPIHVRAAHAARAGGFVLALLAAATATVGDDAARWFSMRGPSCVVGSCLGPHACPGCGLVRSVASAVQGDLARSFSFHPAGGIVALALVALACSEAWAATVPGGAPMARVALRAVPSFAAAAVLVGWILRLAFPGPFDPLHA